MSAIKKITIKEPTRKISVVTGAYPTTKQERIQETTLFTVVAISAIVVSIWVTKYIKKEAGH